MWNFKHCRFICFLCTLLASTALAWSGSAVGETLPEDRNPWAWHHVTVGVKDLDAALAQWIGMMGFEVRSRLDGPDAGLSLFWEIAPDDIQRQAFIGTPGAKTGLIQLVQFRDPAPPVREGAEVFDLLPKNLDVFTKNMPDQFEALRAAGAQFRTETYSDMTTPGGGFREIHMHGHDATNIVLVDTPGREREYYTDKGFSGVVQLISIVPDAQREDAFYQEVMGLDRLSKSLIKGPDIEKVVGLPPGAALDVRIFGVRDEQFGQMEVVDYQGVEGSDRYPRAKPKALGTLHVSYFIGDLAPLKKRLSAFNTTFTEHKMVETVLCGSGPAISFKTPAGLRIEAHQR